MNFRNIIDTTDRKTSDVKVRDLIKSGQVKQFLLSHILLCPEDFLEPAAGDVEWRPPTTLTPHPTPSEDWWELT